MTIKDHIRALYNDYTDARAYLDEAQACGMGIQDVDYENREDEMIDTRYKLMDAIKIVTGLTSDELEKIR